MKTLISGPTNFTAEHLKRMESIGLEITLHLYENEPVKEPEIYDIVVCLNLFKYTPIDKFTSLRFLHLISAGFDELPIEYIEEHKIKWFRGEKIYGIPMAEYAVSAVLHFYKKTQFFENRQKDHLWQRHPGLQELNGKTVCIIGAGDIGTECAKLFSAFGCKIHGVARTNNMRKYFNSVVKLNALDDLLLKSDIVITAIPLTSETHHLLNRERINNMKNGTILISMSRGSVIEENALIEALETDRLQGAVLDVFEQEPLKADSPLWDMPNVLITPHNSFIGENNATRLCEAICRNLKPFCSK